MIAYALVTFCAAFLGCYLAGLLGGGPVAPRHPKAAPHLFPVDQGLDLDELDRPTRGAGEL